MKGLYVLVSIFFLVLNTGKSQVQYQLRLESTHIEGLGGLQSYAYGSYQNYWVLIGGRLDGLHMRQPFASFSPSGNNNQIILIDIDNNEVWKRPLSTLAQNLQEQLSSTNMQFYQNEENLVLTGGYGYSATNNDHITFPFITVINLKNLVNNILDEKPINDDFILQEDQLFTVAGGQLKMINESYYLVGGHKFMGRYNPHGPDHGPGFFQEYTNEIRPFNLEIIGKELHINHLQSSHDERHLQRRDYNLVPQIFNGKQELMLFSGVFQNDVDLPWLYPVLINENEHLAREEFIQYFNHYHCAVLPIFDDESGEMHNIFFGGIAQFYMEDGTVVQDDDVPFVKTIADVTRLSNGNLIETVLPIEMPGLFGASSEFIVNPHIFKYSNEVIKGNQINHEESFIGYIFGGIKSDAKNIFWVNDGTQSRASDVLYKVYIKKIETNNLSSENISNEPQILIFPNPSSSNIRVVVSLKNIQDIKLELFNTTGELIYTKLYLKGELTVGDNYLTLNNISNLQNGHYLVKLAIGKNDYLRKVVVNN